MKPRRITVFAFKMYISIVSSSEDTKLYFTRLWAENMLQALIDLTIPISRQKPTSKETPANIMSEIKKDFPVFWMV